MAVLAIKNTEAETINVHDLISSDEIAKSGIVFIDRGMDDGIATGTDLDGILLSVMVEGYKPTELKDDKGKIISTTTYGQIAGMFDTDEGIKKATLGTSDIVTIGQSYSIKKTERLSKQQKPVYSYMLNGRSKS